MHKATPEVRHLTFDGGTSLCGASLLAYNAAHDAPVCEACKATADHPRYVNTGHTTPEWQALCVTCKAQTLHTEDGVPFTTGARLFNYYDCKWGTVANDIDSQGWFTFNHDDGTRAMLNGQRVASYNPRARK